MGAGVARTDRLQSVLRQLLPQLGSREHASQVAHHFLGISGDEKIASWMEQLFGIIPWGADQRNATGERFENPNRRNPRQGFDVGRTRNMHRGFELREDFWDLE